MVTSGFVVGMSRIGGAALFSEAEGEAFRQRVNPQVRATTEPKTIRRCGVADHVIAMTAARLRVPVVTGDNGFGRYEADGVEVLVGR